MSITGLGQSYKEQALGGLRDVAKMEASRENANEAMAAQHKQTEISSTVSGAAMGAMVGAEYGSAAGPWGIAAGVVIGGIAGYLGANLF